MFLKFSLSFLEVFAQSFFRAAQISNLPLSPGGVHARACRDFLLVLWGASPTGTQGGNARSPCDRVFRIPRRPCMRAQDIEKLLFWGFSNGDGCNSTWQVRNPASPSGSTDRGGRAKRTPRCLRQATGMNVPCVFGGPPRGIWLKNKSLRGLGCRVGTCSWACCPGILAPGETR